MEQPAHVRPVLVRADVPVPVSPVEVVSPAADGESNQSTVCFIVLPLSLLLPMLSKHPDASVCLVPSSNTAAPPVAAKDHLYITDETDAMQPIFVKCEFEAAEMALKVSLKIKQELEDEGVIDPMECVNVGGTPALENVMVKEEAPAADRSVKVELDAVGVPDSRSLPNEDGLSSYVNRKDSVKIEIINDGNLQNCSLDSFDGAQEEGKNGTSVEALHTGLDLLNSKYDTKTGVLPCSISSYTHVPYVSLSRLPPSVAHHYHNGSRAKRMKVSCDGDDDDDDAESVYVRGPLKIMNDIKMSWMKRHLKMGNLKKKHLHLLEEKKKVPLPGCVPCGDPDLHGKMASDSKLSDDSTRLCTCCVPNNKITIEKQLTDAAALEKQVLNYMASLVLPHSIFESRTEDLNAVPVHKIICHLCKYTSSATLAMQYHLQMHKVDADKLSFCAQCPYITDKEEFLCLHFNEHDLNRRLENDINWADATSHKLKLCSFCDFVNHDEESMNIHAFQAHSCRDFTLIFRYERFYCNASKKFAWKYEGEKPFIPLFLPVKNTESSYLIARKPACVARTSFFFKY